MKKSDFVINLKDFHPILTKTGCGPLVTALNSIPGAPLTKLTIADFLRPGVFEQGVYLFEEGNKYKMKVMSPPSITLTDYWYIGKCSSLSFQSRLGGHLDTRVDGYMNHLMKYTAWILSKQDYKSFIALPDVQKQKYYNDAASVIQDLRLKFISFAGVSVSKNFIDDLEKCLKKTLHPYLNDPQRGVFKASTLTIKKNKMQL